MSLYILKTKIKTIWHSIPDEVKLSAVFFILGVVVAVNLQILDYRAGWQAHQVFMNQTCSVVYTPPALIPEDLLP